MVLHCTAVCYRGLYCRALRSWHHCSSKVQTPGPPHHIELLAILRYHTHWTPHHLEITYVLGIANTVITTHPLRDCTCNQRDLPINRHQPTRLPLSINYYYFYPCPAPVPAPSQKPSQGDISGTKRGVMAVCDEKPISILETGTWISFFQSHVWDENENFFLSISCFETRTRIEIETTLARIFENLICCSFID